MERTVVGVSLEHPNKHMAKVKMIKIFFPIVVDNISDAKVVLFILIHILTLKKMYLEARIV